MTNMKIANLLLAGLLSLAAAQEVVAQGVVTKPDITSPVPGEKISPAALNFIDEVKYSPSKTTFRLFAPKNSKAVTLRIYAVGQGGTPL